MTKNNKKQQKNLIFTILIIPLILLCSIIGLNNKIALAEDSFSVNFNINGIVCADKPENQTVIKDQKATLPANPTFNDYVFEGWFQSDDNGVTLNETAFDFNTLITENLELFAKWSNVPYTVKYYFQNKENEEYSIDDTKTANLKGVSTQLSEAVELPNGETSGFALVAIEQQKIAADGSTEIEVKYNRNTYNITYNKNGGDFEVEPSLTYKYGSFVTLPTNISKEGYNFLGWYDNEAFSGDAKTEIADTSTGDKAYFAKFEKESYILSFTTFTTENIVNMNVEFGDTLNLPTPTRDGYKFNGWYLSENNGNGSGEKFELPNMNDIGANGQTLNLYASWTILGSFTVRWLDGDGNVLHTDENVLEGTIPTKPLLEENPTKTEDAQYSYTFNKWPDLEPINENMDVIAKFIHVQKKYTCKFVDFNGDILQEEKVPYNDPTPIFDGKTPTRPSNDQFTYEFVAWKNLPVTITENVTIEPDFDPKSRKFIIKWYIDSKYPSKSTVEYGKLPECSANLTKSDNDLGKNYVFVKWDKDLVPAVSDAEYHAIFRPTTLVSYNIEYNLNGGEFNGDYSKSYNATVGIKLPTNVAKKGYVFGGWYLRNDLIGEKTNNISNEDFGDKLFYAKWNVKKLSQSDSEFKQEIVCEDGIDGNAEFVIKVQKNSNVKFSTILTDDEKIETIYSSELMLNGAALQMPSGNYTVRMAVDTKASKIQVLVVENGKITKKIATVENGYATWQVSELGDFAILKSKLVESSKIGQLIGGFVLGFSVATIVCFALVTLIVLIKKKKNEIYI